MYIFILMTRLQPRSTRTATLCPYTTLFRDADIVERGRPMTLNSLESFGAALRVIDDVWALVQATGWNSDKSALLRLPDIGVATIAKRAADGRDLLDRIAGIDVDTLDRKSTRLNSSH